jgi:hypothetical protein
MRLFGVGSWVPMLGAQKMHLPRIGPIGIQWVFMNDIVPRLLHGFVILLLSLIKHMFHSIQTDLRDSMHYEMSYILPTKTTPQGRLV